MDDEAAMPGELVEDYRRGLGMPFRGKMPAWKTAFAKALRRRATIAEQALWLKLRKRPGGYKWRRQAPLLGYIAGFYCPRRRLVIELDGDSHDKLADAQRDANLAARGIRTLRFEHRRVHSDIEGVLATIHSN